MFSKVYIIIFWGNLLSKNGLKCYNFLILLYGVKK